MPTCVAKNCDSGHPKAMDTDSSSHLTVLTPHVFRRPKSESFVSPTYTSKRLNIMHTLIKFQLMVGFFTNAIRPSKIGRLFDKILKPSFYGL